MKLHKKNMAIQHNNISIIHQLRAYQKALDLSLPAMTELDLLFTALQVVFWSSKNRHFFKEIFI